MSSAAITRHPSPRRSNSSATSYSEPPTTPNDSDSHPDPDFNRARDHLGPWSGPTAITFGCNGKPTYISGPHDNPDHVLRTLRRAVGRDGFNYTVGIDLTELPLTG